MAGCVPKKVAPADFAFVTPTTTFEELSLRLPPPDRAYLQDKTIFCEWDLANTKLFMRLKDQAPPFSRTNRVQMVGVLPRRDFTDFSTNRRTHEEPNTP